MNHNKPAHNATTTTTPPPPPPPTRPRLHHIDQQPPKQYQALQHSDPKTPPHNRVSSSSFSGSSARSRQDIDEKGLIHKLTQLTRSSRSRQNKQNVLVPNDTDIQHSRSNRTAADAHTVGGQVTTTLSTSVSASSIWQRWCPVRPSTAACVTILLLSTTCSLCSASLCEPQSWWDEYKDKCIPCTMCQGDTIPLRPCQVHRDTVCGSIYDLKIDWVVLSKTEPNWKERRKFDGLDYGLDHHHLTAEQLQQLQEESDPMDWQTAALFLAVLACLLFFIVAACILVHHMRQWRRMERRLDQDVEELSTKLMAKLAEVQSLEGGTFFIGNADALRISPSSAAAAAASLSTATAFHHPQHVMLPEKSDKHHHLQPPLHHQHLLHQQDRRLFNVTTATTLKSGNVYIEENSSKC